MVSVRRWNCSIVVSLVSTTSMSFARFSSASIRCIAFAVGPRSPKAFRVCMRLATVSIGQTIRSVVTLAPPLAAIFRYRRRCSSDLNDPTATTSLFVARESVTAAAIAEYACKIASLLRSPEAVRAAVPSSSAKVSDAKLTAFHRSTVRRANVDFPAPGTPQTIMRCRLSIPCSSDGDADYRDDGRSKAHLGPTASTQVSGSRELGLWCEMQPFGSCSVDG